MSDTVVAQRLIEDMDVQSIDDFASFFMYQGFSPQLVFDHLAKIKREKSIGEDEFKLDVKAIIVMGVIMGNYNDHNSNRISTDGKAKGDQLIEKYKLKKGRIGKDRKDVNVPRILAAFPIVSSKVAMCAAVRQYGDEFSTSYLPKCLKAPVFPALVPRQIEIDVRSALLVLSNAYSSEQTIAISPIKDPLEAYNKQKNYTRISNSSSVPPEDKRIAYIKTLDFGRYENMRTCYTAVQKIVADLPAFPDVEKFKRVGLVVQ